MKASVWFAKQTQQSVMSRAGVIPVIVRSGNSQKSAKERPSIKKGSNLFIVGKSKVGGCDRVGGIV